MDRPVQVGDSAVVSVENQQFSYPIISIDSSGIRTSNYLLVPIGSQWQIRAYNTPHTVTFVQRSTFSGTPEINWNILLQLDLTSLSRACQSSSAVNQICQNDSFWKAKVEYDFGSVSQYKPEEITYRQQYEDLIQATDPDQAALEGRLDKLVVLETKNRLPTQIGANWAAGGGHLHILEWLEARGILPNDHGAGYAAERGHINVLEWLESRGILSSRDVASEAAGGGHINILEWLAARGILPTQDGVSFASQNGQLDALKWLAARGILATREDADMAAGGGHLDVLEWLKSRGIFPTQDAANLADEGDHLDVLAWLAVRGIYPED